MKLIRSAMFEVSHATLLARVLVTLACLWPALMVRAQEQLLPAAVQPEETNQQRQSPPPSGGNNIVPFLSPREKLKYGVRQAFLRPENYLFTGIGAIITEATERDQSHKTTSDRVGDGFTRFAINFGTRSTRSLLGAGVYPAIFNQDPRYKPSPHKGFRRRALYAVSRVFVTEGARGQLQPNYSRLGGNISASALANLWERSTPGRDRIGVGPTFERFGITLGVDMVSFVIFREFLPDIKRKLFNR